MKDTITPRELNLCITIAHECAESDNEELLLQITKNELTETGYLLTEEQQILLSRFI